MSDDFGPRWCVNSEEVSIGIMFYIVMGIIVFSVIPIFFLGIFLASIVWNVKIFKYPIAFILACAYGIGLLRLYDVSKSLTFGVILFAWLILDYVIARREIKQMWLVRTTQRLFRWLFSK